MTELATSIIFAVIFIPASILAIGMTFRDAGWAFVVSIVSACVVLVRGLNSPHFAAAAKAARREHVEMAAMSAGLTFVIVALGICAIAIFFRKTVRLGRRVAGRFQRREA